MPGPIIVKFTMSKAEYLAAYRQHLFRSKLIQIGSAFFLLWIVLPLLCFIYFLRMGIPHSFSAAEFVWPAVGLFALVRIFGFGPSDLYRKTNPGFRDQEQEYRFTEAGADIRTAISEAKLDWKVWLRFKETPQFFLLFPGTPVMHILPKRAFASPEDLESFRVMLRARIPTR
jgi:hypothetical protein